MCTNVGNLSPVNSSKDGHRRPRARQQTSLLPRLAFLARDYKIIRHRLPSKFVVCFPPRLALSDGYSVRAWLLAGELYYYLLSFLVPRLILSSVLDLALNTTLPAVTKYFKCDSIYGSLSESMPQSSYTGIRVLHDHPTHVPKRT